MPEITDLGTVIANTYEAVPDRNKFSDAEKAKLALAALSVNSIDPDVNGNIALTADDVPVSVGINVKDALDLLNSTVNGKQDQLYMPDGTTEIADFRTPLQVYSGTVYAHTWPGVTEGALGDDAARTANGLALQEAIDFADANKMFFELRAGTYEIKKVGGLVIPAGTGFYWKGDYAQTAIVQYEVNTPILQVGSVANGGTETKSATIDGVTLSYGVDQTGLTGANAFVIGKCWRCTFVNIVAGSTETFKPYKTCLINGGSSRDFYFSNTMRDCRFSFAQHTVMEIGKNGTGNVYQNLYIGGGAPNYTTILGQMLSFSAGGGAFMENVLDQVNVEWGMCNNPILFNVARNVTCIGMHMEGLALTGANPMFVKVDSSQVNFIGCNGLDCRMSTVDGVTGTPSIFTGASNEGSVRFQGFEWFYENPTGGKTAHVDTNFIVFNHSGSGNGRRTYAGTGFNFFDFTTNLVYTPFLRLSNLLTETGYYTNLRVIKLDQYFGSHPYPDVAHGYLDLVAGTDTTVYGVWSEMMIRGAGGTINTDYSITLSNRKGVPGSIGANIPVKEGAALMITKENSGTANVIVKNWDGSIIGTITANLSPLRVIMNKGGNWQAATAPLLGERFEYTFAISDETTDLTAGTNKIVWPVPFACKVQGIVGGLSTVSAGGGGTLTTVDANKNGTSILSTKLTWDVSEPSTLTAATQPVLTTVAGVDYAAGDVFSLDIDAVNSTPGKGAKITIYGQRFI